jgi:hypothetical protein
MSTAERPAGAVTGTEISFAGIGSVGLKNLRGQLP